MAATVETRYSWPTRKSSCLQNDPGKAGTIVHLAWCKPLLKWSNIAQKQCVYTSDVLNRHSFCFCPLKKDETLSSSDVQILQVAPAIGQNIVEERFQCFAPGFLKQDMNIIMFHSFVKIRCLRCSLSSPTCLLHS